VNALSHPKPVTYTWRRELCSECDGTRHCDECGGFGKVDAGCAECLRGVPLSDQGLCETCTDACTLPLAEYQAKHPSGWALAELCAMQRKVA
jgi:hypothetical protein